MNQSQNKGRARKSVSKNRSFTDSDEDEENGKACGMYIPEDESYNDGKGGAFDIDVNAHPRGQSEVSLTSYLQ